MTDEEKVTSVRNLVGCAVGASESTDRQAWLCGEARGQGGAAARAGARSATAEEVEPVVGFVEERAGRRSCAADSPA